MSLAGDGTLRITAQWLAENGFQKKWDEIENHPLGENIGTRVIAEMGEDWYEVILEIGWWKRDELNAKQSMQADVKINARVAQRLAANSVGGDEEISIPVQQNDDTAARKLRFMDAYISGWSHSTGKPPTNDLKKVRPLSAWAVLEIIDVIHKGQSLKTDTPFAGSSKTS